MDIIIKDEWYNIPDSIIKKIGKNLHNKEMHPVNIIKNRIYYFFDSILKRNFSKFDSFEPFVSTENNFDLLLIPSSHPSRSKNDTFYMNKSTVLRTHTSAHQNNLLKKGETSFLVTGDVYRKDEINATHYPIFHQMEGLWIVNDGDDPIIELKLVLSKLVEFLFPGKEYRFNTDYFPFTEPSFETEVKFGDKWLEILGCGVTHAKILEYNSISKKAVAFGLGLERLCMIMFDIPDIRLLWTDDPKFLTQFTSIDSKFLPYSKLSPIKKDISFWIKNEDIDILVECDTEIYNWKYINNFFSVLREICGDNIENVDLYDKFKNIKTGKISHTFKLTFSPTANFDDSAEFNIICNNIMEELRNKINKVCNVELR
jgi:phenylalanyl-tRNA synthetase alpha chain